MNVKQGDGFRINSNFNSTNYYSYIAYKPTDNLNFSFELTHFNYLAQQPGGLTDIMFNEDVFQSNRERNWFAVNWLLANFQSTYKKNNKTSFSFNTFILSAYRNAIGFRTNRVDQIDSFEERDLIKTSFDNLGSEIKILHEYNLFNKNIFFLVGARLYDGSNLTQQGPGSSGDGPNFNMQTNIYPNYENQSEYENPNINYAIFSEQLIYLNNKMSITPGLRFEYIKTESNGFYKNINTDAAGNIILNDSINTDNKRFRSFFLFGLGYSFKFSKLSEFYANCSQNYRAVTFSDINTINPNFIINSNINDENGYTLDFGFRGNYNAYIFYDLSTFYLFYNDRIGFVQKSFDDGSVKNEKGNVGNAKIYGQEILVSVNVNKIFSFSNDYRFNYFVNFSNINSQYVDSQVNGVLGNQVEFVPKFNLKTGIDLGFKNLSSSIQYTFLSKQFTDATNSIESDLSGVIGEIPSYNILDVSCSYIYGDFKFESGVNNVLNSHYFTTRATGYPGPGIIPSPIRNFYITIQYKL